MKKEKENVLNKEKIKNKINNTFFSYTNLKTIDSKYN